MGVIFRSLPVDVICRALSVPLNSNLCASQKSIARSIYGVRQFAPQRSLPRPVEFAGNRLQLGQVKRIAAPLDARQKQNCLLDVGRQEPQIQDLGHPRPRHMPQSRYLGLVLQCTVAQQVIALDGQRQRDGRSGGPDPSAAGVLLQEGPASLQCGARPRRPKCTWHWIVRAVVIGLPPRARSSAQVTALRARSERV